MEELEKIEANIENLIYQLIGTKISDRNKNLLDDDLGIPIVDWLYIIQELEKRYHKNIYQAIANENYTFFTIH